MNEPQQPPPPPSRDRKRNRVLAAIAFVYALVAGGLLIGLFIATARHELTGLPRVVGLGCYGVPAVGALLHVAVGVGLLRGKNWLGQLVAGTTIAIVVPLIAAALFFLVIPFAPDLNHAAWSVVALFVGVPWPLYVNFTRGSRV